MKDKYTHLLIDLDHTLWDFDENCRSTISELHQEYFKLFKNIEPETLFRDFLKINNFSWHQYDHNLITKEELRAFRFKELLRIHQLGHHDIAEELEEKYLYRCPKKGKLIPHALEFIKSVYKNYNITIITNGFQKTQEEKIKYSGLEPYMHQLHTSESTGFKKPDQNFFNTVLEDIKVEKSKCLIIGDNPYTDIRGAHNIGIDSLWVNIQNFDKNIKSTFYLNNLSKAHLLFEQKDSSKKL
jgi:putative hydrolase of the HAD superfamily